ncbi:MAG: SMI1/KNR4 family protein [Candidatus Cohnella colombiensis]|uniref:SMI1/KNR4 family protein n=1 Tax=Candidatus Cohnella colombiensis TaxID=3121368 RepID=A0AA95JHI7_9BACL|nr:MAG: SMI1/KNR4 family protein [Cohnella sp.]
MWKEFISELECELSFNQPASIESINSAEIELNVQFPQTLKELLLESNGVLDEFECDALWPLERIIEENKSIRIEEQITFNNFLLFSDAGNGDLFAFSIKEGNDNNEEIYVWNHEDESREIVSTSLKDFISGWFEGTIGI